MEREYNKIIIKYAYLRLGKIIFLLLNNLKTQFVESIVQKGHIQTINITKKKKKTSEKTTKHFSPLFSKEYPTKLAFNKKKKRKLFLVNDFQKYYS